MKRILITNFHSIGGGGHIPYVESLLRLAKEGCYEIAVAVPKTSRLFALLSDQHYPYFFDCDFPSKIQKELPRIIKNVKRFQAIIHEFSPDIVHVNGSPDLSIALWAYPFQRPFQLVRTHHAIRHIGRDFYHRYIYEKVVAKNIYVSASAREISSEKGLVLPNSFVIENGVDLSHFSPMPKDTAFAKEWGLKPDIFYFGSCAGTGQYKRIDTIIDAAVLLKEKTNRPFGILILGNERAADILKQRALEKGFHEFAYCGFHHDVRPFVSHLDVGFVLSDSVETISFAAREMLAMGKPLLSSSFSGLKENVKEGYNGLLVSPGSVEETAKAMQTYLEMSHETYQTFSSHARDFAVAHCDIATQIAKHDALYQSLF